MRGSGLRVSGASRAARRVGSAFALALVLLLGSITAGPSVHADGPVAFFYGLVVADANGALAVRVRAVSSTGVVCGSADVQPAGDGAGFYAMNVVTGATKAGCPQAGQLILFTPVYGLIDEGTPATQAAVMEPGAVTQLHLARSSQSAVVGGFTGTPPASGSYAEMRWAGPSHVPTEQALATLGFPVSAVYHLDAATGRYHAFIPGAPDWASTYATVTALDDVIVVRAP